MRRLHDGLCCPQRLAAGTTTYVCWFRAHASTVAEAPFEKAHVYVCGVVSQWMGSRSDEERRSLPRGGREHHGCWYYLTLDWLHTVCRWLCQLTAPGPTPVRRLHDGLCCPQRLAAGTTTYVCWFRAHASTVAEAPFEKAHVYVCGVVSQWMGSRSDEERRSLPRGGREHHGCCSHLSLD